MGLKTWEEGRVGLRSGGTFGGYSRASEGSAVQSAEGI